MSAPSSARVHQLRPSAMLDWLCDGPRAQYGTAVARMLLGLSAVLLVLRNVPDREFLWGAGSSWVEPFRQDGDWDEPWFGFFSAGDSGGVLDLKLAALALVALAMTVGLGGRLSVLLVLLGTTSLTALSPTSVDTEDIMLRIMLTLLLACRSTDRLSLDAVLVQRRTRSGRRPRRRLPEWISVPLHNTAVALIVVQLCLVYVMAALAKLRGAAWRDGSAMHYTLHLDQYTPWPELSHALAGWPLLVALMTWSAIVVQLAFPFLLLSARTRPVAVLALIALHAGIALLLGLGLFSLLMVAADAVLLSDESVRRPLSRRTRQGQVGTDAASRSLTV